MKRFVENLKSIPSWRVILAVILLFCMAYRSFSDLAIYGQPSFQEMILLGFNNVATIQFFVIFLLLVADLGYKNDKTEKSKGESTFGSRIAYAVFLCALFAALYILFCLLIMLLIGRSVNISDKFNGIRLIGLEWISPALAMAVSVTFFYLRFVFLALIVSAVNSRSKKIPYGYAAGFAVCLVDAIAYYHFSLFNPIGVFPFEHTYLESALRLTNNMPLDIIISVSYWLVLIAAAGLVYKSGSTKHLKEEVDNYESNHF